MSLSILCQSADQLIRVVQELNTLAPNDPKRDKIDILSTKMIDTKRSSVWQKKYGTAFNQAKLPDLLTPWKPKKSTVKQVKDKSSFVMNWIERETTDRRHNMTLTPLQNIRYYTHKLKD